ncbi:hypothetical protein [Cryobacterium arcticum]|uniref:hypothetical protein n=1 Tax=Cryobacterium arcticum TaxID=670052 RepID=UPI0012EDC99C|nr:hypothetical protein [Cryobacterium arcticum]
MSQSVAMVWADDLERVTLEDAVGALKLHYQERPDVWLQPGHVIAGARRVRDRRERQERIDAPRALTGNVITLDRAKFERDTQASIEKHRAEKAARS